MKKNWKSYQYDQWRRAQNHHQAPLETKKTETPNYWIHKLERKKQRESKNVERIKNKNELGTKNFSIRGGFVICIRKICQSTHTYMNEHTQRYIHIHVKQERDRKDLLRRVGLRGWCRIRRERLGRRSLLLLLRGVGMPCSFLSTSFSAVIAVSRFSTAQNQPLKRVFQGFSYPSLSCLQFFFFFFLREMKIVISGDHRNLTNFKVASVKKVFQNLFIYYYLFSIY